MSFPSGLSVGFGFWSSASFGLMGCYCPYCPLATPVLHCLIDLTYLPLVRSFALNNKNTEFSGRVHTHLSVCRSVWSRVICDGLLTYLAFYCTVLMLMVAVVLYRSVDVQRTSGPNDAVLPPSLYSLLFVICCHIRLST